MLKGTLLTLAAIIAATAPARSNGSAEPMATRTRAAGDTQTNQPNKSGVLRTPQIVVQPEKPINPCQLWPLTAEEREQFERQFFGIERPRWD